MKIRIGRPANWFEPIMTTIIFIGLGQALFFYLDRGYLPQPFFYDPHDTWMDWFNPAYWAYEPGTYDSWGTIYPPLSFVFLKIFSLSHCYANGADPYAVRSCDWLGLLSLHAFWCLNIFLLWRTFKKVHRPTALWRTLALGFGLPTISGLERGNLVIVCFTFVILGFGPLLKSARIRWICVGIAVNFKVYLIAALFPQLLRRKWLWFEGALFSTLAIYLVSFIIFADGTPIQIYRNIASIGGGYEGFTLTDLWNSATYNPFVAVLDVQYLLLAGHLGTRNIDFLIFLLPLLMTTGKAMIAIAAIAAWLRPEAVPMHRLTFLGMAFAMIMSETGGYTECFLIFLVMHEQWRGVGRRIALIASYILLVPMDIPIDELPIMVIDSFLSGRSVFVNYYVALGHFIRPALVLTMAISMAAVTICEVSNDVRKQGWQGRWRFRRDVPILPLVARPTPPSH